MRAADLSDWNAPADQINWPVYRAWSSESGAESCLIFKATEGDGVTMKNWRGYVDACNANHITHAIHYHFARPDLGNTGAGEADYFLSVVKGALEPGSLCMLDLEHPASEAWLLEWLQTVEQATGTIPTIYTYRSFAQEYLSGFTALARYPLGLADYGAQPPCPAPWKSYLWWQFTDKLTVPGIPGTVDANQFYGTIGGSSAAGKASAGRMIIQHPGDNARIDAVFIASDGNVWHITNNDDGLAGLCADAPSKAANLGAPEQLAPLSVSASWDNTGNYLNIIAAGVSGQIYAKCMKGDGSVDMDWRKVASQIEQVKAAVIV